MMIGTKGEEAFTHCSGLKELMKLHINGDAGINVPQTKDKQHIDI